MKKLYFIALSSLFLTGCNSLDTSQNEKISEKNIPENLADQVSITEPKEGAVITSPVKIHGRAPGNWFFEATAPVMVTDWDGKILNQHYVQTEGEWMTTELVNFSGELEFNLPEDIPYHRGTLILQRSNPSGLPQNDSAIEIPILFEENSETLSYKDISFSLPENFEFATNSEQISKKSYIPACNEPFDFCLYYSGNQYEGTNFESAGLRILNRTDLNSAESCLNTPPEGYTSLKPDIHNEKEYTVSLFSPLGDAGMGHYSTGKLYRLSFLDTCYEFETRIGQSQFANYELGTIKEFTDEDQENIENSLQNILSNITFKTIGKISFPSDILFLENF